MNKYYVYIMSNAYRTVLYIGVTNDIERRVAQHKNYEGGFTKKYDCKYLVYYEEYNDVNAAISREKQLKNWRREWKDKLIAETNPKLDDLSADWY